MAEFSVCGTLGVSPSSGFLRKTQRPRAGCGQLTPRLSASVESGQLR